MVLTLPVVSYKDFEVQESLPDEVTLADEYFRLRGHNKVKKINTETELPYIRLYDYDLVVAKSSISGILCGYAMAKEAYEVSMEVCGNDNVCLVFENKAKALEFHRLLLFWKFGI